MENMEIILLDFDKNKVDDFFYNELNLLKAKLISSHFYDTINAKDLSFSQINSIKEILTPKGTASITVKAVHLGATLCDVVILLSFDETRGEITFNIPENEIFKNTIEESNTIFRELDKYLNYLKDKYNIPKIILGYEPALDEDMRILEVNKNMNYERVILKYFDNFE